MMYCTRPVGRVASVPPVRSSSRESMPSLGGTLSRQPAVKRPPKPGSKDAVITWFKQTEMLRGVLRDKSGKVNKWFHGILTRAEAEDLLSDKQSGTFLVRVSEKIWGYTISVKANDR